MPKCTFCNKEYEIHKGITLIDSKSGKINHFCSSKCRKNAEMGRKKKEWAQKKKGAKD